MRSPLTLLTLTVVVAGRAPAAGPVCALLDPDKDPRVALLEARLLADPVATWVERAEVEKVLREQRLQALFSPQGVRERARLGRLLKADLLVLVRPAKGAPEPALEVVVSETVGGLRLLVRGVLVTKDAEVDVAGLLTAVREGRARHGEGVKEVVAVPPFVSHDLELTHDHLKGAYAKLVEAVALGRTGVAVVELAEAEALAREIALAAPGGTVDRPPPVYLFGEFRNDGRGDKQTVALKLRAERGGKPVGKAAAVTVRPDAVPEALREWAAGVLDALVRADRPRPPADPKGEAELLAGKARALMHMGTWADALALLEASLLLDPKQPMVHGDALRCIEALQEQAFKQGWIGPGVFKSEEYEAGWLFHRRGLYHFEAFYTLGGNPAQRRRSPTGFWLAMDSRLAESMTPRAQKLFEEVRRERRDTYLRLFNRELQKGEKNDARSFAVTALHVLPSDPPDQRQRLQELAAKYIPQPKNVPYVGPADPAAAGPGPGRLKLAPIGLTLAGAGPGESLPRSFQGLFPAGPGIDVLWTNEAIYLMKEKGMVRALWKVGPDRGLMVAAPVFDGKYLWTTVNRRGTGPRLLVLDPAAEKVWDVSAAEGLPRPPEGPAAEPTVWAAPLGPGRVCLVGSFAQRAWVGEATFDPAARAAAVKVYFEAREAPVWSDREQWKRAEVGFRPALVTTLRGPPGADGEPARRVVVVRGSHGNPTLKDYPLVVDPDRRTVEVLHQPLAGGTSTGLYPSLCGCAGGRMFYIRPGPLGKNPRPGGLVELALPGPAERVVVADAPYSQGPYQAILAHEGKVHFVMEHYREHRPVQPPEGKRPTPTVSPGQTRDAAYWVLDPERNTAELVASRVPGLRAFHSSAHYGLVAVVITDLHSPGFVWTLNSVEIEGRPPK